MRKADLNAVKRRSGGRTRSDRRTLSVYSVQEAKGADSAGSREGMETRRRGLFDVALPGVLVIIVALGLGGASFAGDGKWSVRLEPMYMEVYGHDQHVLTIHEIDFGSTPQLDNRTAVNLDTDAGTAIRAELQYTKEKWGWGVDVFSLLTSQGVPDQSAAADGPSGPINQVVFETADRSYMSADPSQVLYYNVLEDTSLQMWTVDFYGIRTLADKPNSGIDLQFGIRFGDFDNDYRAVVGLRDAGGTRYDASSNYPRMQGPLVGLSGNVQWGKSSVQGYIGQSLLIGNVELTHTSRDFFGPFGDEPAFFAQERLHTEKDVAIPITEFRVNWTYKVSKLLSLGVGANTSAWWDVPVPPGVTPIENGNQMLSENTLVLFGLAGAVVFTF
jgi:hypothetical protein